MNFHKVGGRKLFSPQSHLDSLISTAASVFIILVGVEDGGGCTLYHHPAVITHGLFDLVVPLLLETCEAHFTGTTLRTYVGVRVSADGFYFHVFPL